MNDNELSLSFGYNRNWLAVIKKNNIDKYNWLISFNDDKLYSLWYCESWIKSVIYKIESLSLQEGFNSKINKLNLFSSHKNNQGEILKDNLYKLRDRPLSIKLSFIQKLIILDKELLK